MREGCPAPRYTPFSAPWRFEMGAKALDPKDWIQLDDDREADLAEKRRLLASRHDEVVAVRPGSEAAQAELATHLARHLARHHADRYEFADGVLRSKSDGESWTPADTDLAPIDQAGRWVQEDLCLMQKQGEAWHLTAASVCFPTRWRLGDKIGRPMAEIHAPVPGLEARLGRRIDNLFARLGPARGVWRVNWSLLDDPALFQPAGHGEERPVADLGADNAGARIWLRSERQTLTSLPRSGAIVFTIRIHRSPLSALAGRPKDCAALAGVLATLSPEMSLYKSVRRLQPALSDWLRRHAA